MSFTFPKAKPRQIGYEPAEVDAFIAKAREQYAHREAHLMTSLDLRRTEFSLQRGGYSVSAVDAAIDRLEDAFAEREIQTKRQFGGVQSLHDRQVAIRQLITARLERPVGKRFDNTGLILRGYDRKQVEKFLASVQQHLVDGKELDLNSVRRAVFRVKRGGYAENQVDAFIDRVVEILHLERYS